MNAWSGNLVCQVINNNLLLMVKNKLFYESKPQKVVSKREDLIMR